jgi:tetratricopeptide (TPR) repeat protein
LSDAALSGQGVGEIFVQLNALFAQQNDKRAVLTLIRDLAQPYPKSAEAHFAIALAAFTASTEDANFNNEALAEVDRALALRPDWERAALLKAEILVRTASVDRAVEYLRAFLGTQPESKAAAGALAQFYVEQKRYVEAREILQRLWDKEPEARELEFGVAAIALQMKDYAVAERLLNDLKTAGFGQPGAIDLYLAQVAEETKRYELAIERYKAVTDGDRAWLAKLRIGAMLGKLGRVDEAKRWYADLPAITPEQRVQVRQAEAQMLRDIGDVNAAYRVLEQGLTEQPDAPDLVYDLAMVAEKLNRLDEAESRLKQLVEMRPDDAQALNALGYTLVDRTPRTSEGYALIEKALKLAPNDPFILDSMGWALYRLGRLDEAERYLKRAIAERPDAEIAAHLGEVLWTKGDRESARAVWKPQLETDPENAVLKETVKRLSR